jgi:thioredoxin-related protein
MKNILSSLTTSEKNRILEMHKSATRRNYLNEQDNEIQDLPEVTISAWMNFEGAKQRASEKGGNILMYIYNEGCASCKDYTSKVMSNPDMRKKIKDNNLALGKMVMCANEGSSSYYDPTTKKSGEFVPCSSQEKTLWESFKTKFDVYGVPALMVISGDGSNVVSGPFYGDDQAKIFNDMFNQLAQK